MTGSVQFNRNEVKLSERKCTIQQTTVHCFSFHFALTILCSCFRYMLKKSYSMPDVFSLLMMVYYISYSFVVKLYALNCTIRTKLFSFSLAHTLNEINRGKKIVYFHILSQMLDVILDNLVSFALECIHLFFDIKGSWSSISFSSIHLFLKCVRKVLSENIKKTA